MAKQYDELMGSRIRDLREKTGLTLREVAEQIDMDYSYLGRVERGFIPSTNKIKTIAEFFKVDISYLMGEQLEVPLEMRDKIKEWRSVIEETERRGYTPEDIEKLLDTLDMINRKNK